jgi:hypothetical protein
MPISTTGAREEHQRCESCAREQVEPSTQAVGMLEPPSRPRRTPQELLGRLGHGNLKHALLALEVAESSPLRSHRPAPQPQPSSYRRSHARVTLLRIFKSLIENALRAT